MHIPLSDSISASAVDSAEQLLQDFCLLLLEAYIERCYTATSPPAHVQIRLLGPLATLFSFRYESYNGHIKHLIDSQSDVVTHLLFNNDDSTQILCHHNIHIKHHAYIDS